MKLLSLAIIGALLCPIMTYAQEKRPIVQMAVSFLTPEGLTLLQKQLPGTVTTTDVTPAHTPQELLSILENSSAGSSVDVILLGCDPGPGSPEQEAVTLRAIVKKARSLHMEPLWLNAPVREDSDTVKVVAFNRMAGTVMKEEGVSLVDYEGFSKQPLRRGWTLGRAQAELLTEAIGQWWWTCARANPRMVRESLWSGTPPAYAKNGEDRINKTGRIDHVSLPEIVRYVSPSPATGTALIYFSGGGYGQIGFLRNVDGLGEKLSPLGITVFALKYRTGRSDDVPLLDAARAVRWVRFQSRELGIDANRIGIAGISAGANLTLALASRFSAGDPQSTDPIERVSSRPDFAVVLTSWHHGETRSPFVFPANTPPIFLRHARNDSGFALAEEVVAQLRDASIPLDSKFLDTGGHGAFDQGPDSVGSNWPDEFIPWLEKQGLYTPPRR